MILHFYLLSRKINKNMRDDSKLIWEAYYSSLEEGWKTNLAMLGLGAAAATYPLTHKPHQEVKPKPQQVQVDKSKVHSAENSNLLDYNLKLSKIIKTASWDERYYIPVDKTGKPLLDFKTLSKLRKQYNLPEVSEDSYKALQKRIGKW